MKPMNLRFLFWSMIMIMSMESGLHAQDLSVYRWENRLVLLIAQDENSPELKKQLAIFERDSAGLAERKLMVISSTPTSLKRDFPKSVKTWLDSQRFHKQFHRKGDFEFVLIGLDGGEKLRRRQVLELSELYRIIDSMPMRAAEMRRNNN